MMYFNYNPPINYRSGNSKKVKHIHFNYGFFNCICRLCGSETRNTDLAMSALYSYPEESLR